MISGSRDGMIHVWEMWQWKVTATPEDPLVAQDDEVTAVDVSRSGRFVAIGLSNGAVRLRSTGKNKVTGTVRHRTNQKVTSVRIADDDQHLVSRSVDGTLCQWALTPRKSVHGPLRTEKCGESAVATCNDCKYTVSVVAENLLHVSDPLSGESSANPVAAIRVEESEAIRCVALSNDTRLVASGSSNGGVKVFRRADGRSTTRRPSPRQWLAPIKSLTFSHDEQYVLWVDGDSRVWKWHVSDAEERPSLLEGPESALALWKAKKKQLETDGTENSTRCNKTCVFLHGQGIYSYEPSGNSNDDEAYVKVGQFEKQVELWESDGERAIATTFKNGKLALVGIAMGPSQERKRKFLRRLIDRLQRRN